jgi:hypothetical protein
MVEVVGVAWSEHNKLPIYMSINSVLQISGSTPTMDPSFLMLTQFRLNIKNNLPL